MKRILSFALILGMMLTATACGNTDTESTTDSTPAETTTEAPEQCRQLKHILPPITRKK